ncbi:conserved hypothetical protein [Leishmania infantum JPCM5]|uniref:RNA_polymerase_Rpb4_-_putative n=2 Tax=Leishmania infantum TaxID=5671 RepID=A0A6L0XID7_LEIIN|nr:conserved hypothetical protein [Leishmania infantum JPCM5]CAC9507067.1 RNA_polymerase_Rpb4_-_putative [Leishmania infantum]CAM69602.1 conserved hypothetical protein [Leishmania infantum JPCM5]SUZ43539.1 RNA_polymerase_Rpb4_-_putative [Leishmania infantum]|eukprot:XP_001466563.1 conserved hypothetical protein [Leishmania infantum JPCM5]
MEESYVEGNLGPVFNNAEPLSLPIVARILHEKRIGAEDTDKIKGVLIQSCCEAVDILQEDCAPESMVNSLHGKRLRLRAGGGGVANAHLTGLQIDENGYAVLPPEGTAPSAAAPSPGSRTERMKPFEIIALTTLRPTTTREAVELIPSLYRFEDAELDDILGMLSY